MAKILLINSSAQTQNSHTRALAAELVARLNPQGEHQVSQRDLAAAPLPHLNETTIGAFFTPAEARTPEQAEAIQLSDRLVEELLESDIIVLAAPMYNFGIPSSLKAYLDHIARAGRTFMYTENGPVGLVEGKPLHVVTARGGIYAGSNLDHQAPHLETFFRFLGFKEISFYHAEGMSMDSERDNALQSTRTAIQAVQAA